MASEDLFAEDLDVISELDQDDCVGNILEEEEEEVIEDERQPAPENEINTKSSNAYASATATNEDNETTTSIAPNGVESSSKTTNAAHAEHESKLFQLPLSRIRNLMKLDPDVNIASNEAVFLVTRSTEHFIESLARESYSYTAQAKKKTVQKRDVDLAISAVDCLMFLEGAVNF